MAIIQNREILGRGWKFPFKIGGDTLSHDGPEQSKYETHVLECIRHLFLVQKKTRRGNRDWGSRLFELPFEELTRSPGLAVEFVEDALEKEPRIIVGPVIAETDTTRSTLYIMTQIQFIVTSKKYNLVFPFYESATGLPMLDEIQVLVEET